MVERVDRLDAPPIVGRFYMVPTVRWRIFGKVSNWPVRGPMHTDAEHLNFPSQHYHLDHRFFSAPEAEHILDDWRGAETAAAAIVCVEFTGTPPAGFEKLPAHPTWLRRRCARAELTWPAQSVYELKNKDRSKGFLDLHATFHGAQCKRGQAGWVCPHRNFSLGSIAPVDGFIVCPLHGLRIDAETGIVVPHIADTATANAAQTNNPGETDGT